MRIITNSKQLQFLANIHQTVVVSDEEIVEEHDLSFELIIVDIDSHGVYVAQVIRKSNPSIPIIGICEDLPFSDNRSELRATFIERGGSYLLESPVNPHEIAACILEINRRFCEIQSSTFLLNRRFVINTTDRTISFDGKPIRLSPNELNAFMDLADHFGSIRSADNLMNAVYAQDQDEAESQSINILISSIRKKLNSTHAELGKCIETIWSRGYRLVNSFIEEESSGVT